MQSVKQTRIGEERLLGDRRKRALVTGAASGIGKAAAARLIAEGFDVVIADIDRQLAEQVSAELTDDSGTAIAYKLDVADAAACVQLSNDQDSFDVLVANAGVQLSGALLESGDADWDAVFAVNVKGVANCCRALLPGMLRRKSGAIVVVSSNNAVCGSSGMAAYDASKAALLALVRSIAIEHGSDGIRANAVCPGTTITDYHINRFAKQGVSVDELHEMTAGTGLLNRAAAPEEIANAIWFLASDQASYITGANLMVDAGFSLAGGH